MSAVSAEPEALDELARGLLRQAAGHGQVGAQLSRAVQATPAVSSVGVVALSEADAASRGIGELARSFESLARFVGDVASSFRAADSTLDTLGGAGTAVFPWTVGTTGSGSLTHHTYSGGARRVITATTGTPWRSNATARRVAGRVGDVHDGFESVDVDVTTFAVSGTRTSGAGTGGRLGTDAAHVDVGVFAGGQATGTAAIGVTKTSITGSLRGAAQVGATATVAAGVGSNLLGAQGRATAFVGARAEGSAKVGIGKDGVDVEVSARALLGGAIDADGAVDVLGVHTGGHAGVSYGVGGEAHADVDVGLDKISLTVDLGATIGVGVNFGVDVSISPRDTAKSIGKGAKKAWKRLF